MDFKVSVIVPVYNCKKYLGQAVKSVIDQSVFDSIELILVDDGSTDGSAEICNGYAEKYPNIISLHENNSGVSVARNKGIENARGEYIAFLDSDDRYENNFIEDLLNFADSDLVCCDYYCDSRDEKNLGGLFEPKIYYRSDFDTEFYNKILDTRFYSCWNKLYKKDIIERNKIRFIPGVKYAEDMIFVLEYLKFSDSFRFVDSALYFYNINPENTTSVVKNGFDVQHFIYDYQMKYFKDINAEQPVLDHIEDIFVYKTTCTINSEITYNSFFSAYKYVKRVLSSEFYPLYLKANYTEFVCKYDRVFFTLLKKKKALAVVLWRKMYDLRSRIFK